MLSTEDSPTNLGFKVCSIVCTMVWTKSHASPLWKMPHTSLSVTACGKAAGTKQIPSSFNTWNWIKLDLIVLFAVLFGRPLYTVYIHYYTSVFNPFLFAHLAVLRVHMEGLQAAAGTLGTCLRNPKPNTTYSLLKRNNEQNYNIIYNLYHICM